MEDEIMKEEFKIQPSLQSKENISANEGEGRIKENLKFCIFKGQSGNMIVEMHYVGHLLCK